MVFAVAGGVLALALIAAIAMLIRSFWPQTRSSPGPPDGVADCGQLLAYLRKSRNGPDMMNRANRFRRRHSVSAVDTVLTDLGPAPRTDPALIRRRLEPVLVRWLARQTGVALAPEDGRTAKADQSRHDTEIADLKQRLRDADALRVGQAGDLNRRIAEVTSATERAVAADRAKSLLEQELACEKREREVEKAQNVLEIGRLKGDVETLRRNTGASDDPAKLLDLVDGLRKGTDLSGLGEFCEQLVGITRLVQSRDRSQLSARLLDLDRYVFQSPQAIALAAADNSVTPVGIAALINLQIATARELGEQGLKVIDPRRGDAYRQEDHACAPSDEVLINTDPALNGQVHSCKRIGYRWNDRVLRRAEVKRFVFFGESIEPDQRQRTVTLNLGALPPDLIQRIDEKPGPIEGNLLNLVEQSLRSPRA